MSATQSGIGELAGVVIDVCDLQAAESFWSAVLGVSVAGRGGQYVFFEAQQEGAPQVGLQLVPERRSVKNRVHIDIRVDDINAATKSVLSLGGRRIGSPDGGTFIVMADLEGNEFCLVPQRDQ